MNRSARVSARTLALSAGAVLCARGGAFAAHAAEETFRLAPALGALAFTRALASTEPSGANGAPSSGSAEANDAPAIDLDAGDRGGIGGARLARIIAYWENDGIFKGINRTDRYYTSGLKLDIAWRLADGPADPLTSDSAHDAAMHPAGQRRAFGLSFGQLMFTPDNLSRREPILHDRPYAGWLFGAAYWQWDTPLAGSVRTLDHLEFDLGVVGPSARAGDIQRWAHHTFGFEPIRGWDNQLPDEIAVNITYRKKWRIDGGGYEDFAWDIIPQVEATAGTVYRRIGAGVMLRAGCILPDDYGAGRLADVGGATGQPGDALYAYLRLGGHLTEHNIFLDGTDFSDSQSVSKRPLTGELQVGVEWTHRSGFHFGYAWTFQTDEFWNQRRSHSYATIAIGWRCTF